MELADIMHRITPYWGWYKQRVRRMLKVERLPSDVFVRFMDWRLKEFYLADHSFMLPKHYHDLIPEHMISHLPHRTQVVYRPRQDHSLITRWHENEQELWCYQHVGKRDRDWLYLGKDMWAFRTPEQACEFTLMWG